MNARVIDLEPCVTAAALSRMMAMARPQKAARRLPRPSVAM